MLGKLISCVIVPGAAVLLPACSGIMGGIYDEPLEETVAGYGFVEASDGVRPGSIYIDATDYTRWTYIDFSAMRIDTLHVSDPAPAEWDIAIHRYDVKTNGGSACATGATGFDSPLLTPGDMSPDVWTTQTIVTDMSTMMDGYLSYVESWYSPVVSQWLDVDKSTMPPVYTLSGKVYVVRTADGRHVALRLADYMNTAGVKGYMTIEYLYPFHP